MLTENHVYSRLGMALVSAQRVEWVSSQLISFLAQFDKSIYGGITGEEFLSNSSKALKAKKTLGATFRLVKTIKWAGFERKLNIYLKTRNELVHGFWRNYLNSKSQKQMQTAINFCSDFGKQSEEIERYFKGLLYFLSLRFVKDKNELADEIKKLESDFEFFITNSGRN